MLAGTYARESNRANYDIAPDGKTFVMLRPGAPGRGGQITVLELNWRPWAICYIQFVAFRAYSSIG